MVLGPEAHRIRKEFRQLGPRSVAPAMYVTVTWLAYQPNEGEHFCGTKDTLRRGQLSLTY